MFYATILACTLLNPNACIEANDTRGPYGTEAECLIRVKEMITDMGALLPPVPHSYKFKCQPKGRPV